MGELAVLLGLPRRHAEDALYSERAARAVLTRRSFFAASGALATGKAFSFGKPKRGAFDGTILTILHGPNKGDYVFDSCSTARADGHNVLMANNGSGLWLRVF